MALPAAIQRQVDEAAAAEAAVVQGQAQAEAVITDPTQLAPANEAQSAEQQVVEPPPPVAPSEDWQQKYKSLLGRHARETAELQAATKTAESQMANMQRQIDALMQVRKQDEAKEKQAVDPKDVENFGSDLIEMVQRYAQSAYQGITDHFGAQISALDGRLGELEKSVTGVTTRTEVTLEQQFYASLNAVVSDWEQINGETRWLDWLAEVDPIYGVPRQAALDNARAALDVERVANVFKAYKKAFPPKPVSSLANQVAPNSAGAPAPIAAPAANQQIWAAKAVEKFYSDLAKGRYAGRESEAERIAGEIDAAAAQGRIR